MVFTKFDEFKNRIRLDIVRGNRAAGDEVDPLVEKEVNEKLKKICLDPLSEITGTDTYPRAVVSGKTLRYSNLLCSTQACSVCTARRTSSETYPNYPRAPKEKFWATSK